MINFKTYYTEATKKDILAGLDANVNSIKKAQEYTDKAIALRKHFNDIDKKYPRWKAVKTEDKVDYIENKKNKHIQEENEKYLEQKMYELFDHLVTDPFPSEDRYRFYTYLTPYILTLDYYYDNGNIIPLPRETERAKEMINLLFFSILKYKEVGEYFYNNLKKIDRKYQVGHDADELGEPDDDQEINEATKKDILSGLNKIYSIRDPNDPYNQNVYGEIYFDSDGLFVDDKKYETPKKLPPNCEYIAKGAFIKKGQTPDYNKTFPFVYITDKKLMDTFSSTYGEESFHTNPITVEFMDELYTNLRLQTNDGHYRSGAPHLP